MPLLNNHGAGATSAPAGGSLADPTTKKATKKEAEKKLKARRKAQKEQLLAYLEKVPNLPAEILDIVKDWKNPNKGGGGNFGTPLFNKIFGETPKVGDHVTLQEVFNKTFKGVDKMNELMNKWKQKGTIVEYVHNAAQPLQSQYVIKAIG